MVATVINSDLLYRETQEEGIADLFPNPQAELTASINFTSDLIANIAPISEEATEQEIIADTVDAYLKVREEGTAAVESIALFGRQLGEQLSQAYSILKSEVTPHVLSLAKVIDTKSADLLASQSHNGTAVTADGTVSQARGTFDTVGWRAFGDGTFPGVVCEEFFGTADINHINFGDGATILEKLKGENLYPVHEDTEKYLKESIEKILAANELNVAMSPAELLAVILTCDVGYFTNAVAAFNTANYGLVIEQVKHVLFNITPVIIALRTDFGKLDLSEEFSDKLSANIDKLNDMSELMRAMSIHVRNMLRNARILIITPALVNEDMFDELRNQGSGEEDVTRFIAVNLNDKSADSSVNIPVDDVLSTRDQVLTMYREHEESIEASKQVIIRSSIISAAREVLTQHGNNTCKDEVLVQHAVDNACHVLDSHGEVPMESVLYNFILELHYKDTLLETIYRKIGTKTTEVLKAVGTTDNSVLDVVETAALAEIVADYVVDQLFITDSELPEYQ